MTHRPIGADDATGELPAVVETRIHGWIDDAADLLIPLTEKGSPNGVATLDGGGKVPVNQLPLNVVQFLGTWNAATNTPTLADGVGDTGDTYIVSVAGTQNLGSGPISFGVGDWVLYDGSVWQKVDNTDAVTSVAGLTGAISASDLKTALSLPADTVGSLAAEALARGNADTTLQNNINSEAGTRLAADNALDARLDVLETLYYFANGTDDTTALNVLLAAGVTRKAVRVTGAIKISSALIVGSGVVADFRGASITAITGFTGCMVRNAGSFPVTTGTGSINAASTSLTTALALTVGQTVTIAGADGAGTTVHTATVLSGSGPYTLSVAAKTTVSGAVVKVFNRDTDAHIIGGVWNRGSFGAGSNPGGQHMIYIRMCDNFTVDIEGATSSAQKYVCSIGGVTRGRTTLRGLAAFSDGLHITGPANKITVPLIEGTTGDDTFAITGSDWVAYGDTSGDVTDITVGDIQAVSTAACLFKVIAGNGYLVDAVKVTGQVSGTAATNGTYIGDDNGQASTSGGTYGHIDFGTTLISGATQQLLIQGVSGDVVEGRIIFKGGGRLDRLIRVNTPNAGTGSTARTLKVLNVDLDVDTTGTVNGVPAANAPAILRKDGNNYTVTTLRLTGRFRGNSLVGVGIEHAEGTVTEYQWEFDWTSQSTSEFGLYWTGGTITRLTSLAGSIAGSGNLLRRDSGSGTLYVSIGPGFRALASSRLMDVRTGTTDIRLDGPLLDSLTNAAIFTNGSILRLAGWYRKVGASAFLQQGGSSAIDLLSFALEADFSITGLAKTLGNMGNNTNAGLSCGAGPAVANGSAWKNLYTGSTY